MAAHRVVDQRADGRLRRAGLQVLPARLLRHPEDAGGAVLVGVLGVGALRLLRFELGVLGLEGVGDVLEEDQAEDDVLVLGRVHVVAQRVGGGPELGLEAQGGGAPFVFRVAVFSFSPVFPPSLGVLGKLAPSRRGK